MRETFQARLRTNLDNNDDDAQNMHNNGDDAKECTRMMTMHICAIIDHFDSTSSNHVIPNCDLRVLRIPLDKMSPAQQQFADTMVTELVTAGVSDLPSLTSIFKDLVVEMPGANMEVWVAAVEKKLPGLAMANVCDPTFTTAGFVVVVLVHCLLNV